MTIGHLVSSSSRFSRIILSRSRFLSSSSFRFDLSCISFGDHFIMGDILERNMGYPIVINERKYGNESKQCHQPCHCQRSLGKIPLQ